MPDQLNTVSVMIAPANTAPMSMAMTVTSGISALRSAWRTSTRRFLRPLARASRT